MADFKKILTKIDDAVATFIEQIPAAQADMLRELDAELQRLDLVDGKIKPSVANIKIVTSIKNKLLRVILTDKYKAQVKTFIKAFNEITVLQNEFWRGVESSFKPRSLLKQIKNVAISDTIEKLTESGLKANVVQPVSDILTANITQGGSYAKLKEQLKESLTTTKTPGTLERYAKQITVDSINQYSRNYTQIVSNDLGMQWFAYRNTLISTSRPFCQAMHERRYFHVSEIPSLLRAEGLYYENKGKRVKVPLNPKTNLPDGMYPNTNESNFITLLGGYNCGHQAGPVSENLVKAQAPEIYAQVTATNAYKNWNK